MSASGTGIFDDDVACYTRTLFRDCLKEGQSPSSATKTVLRQSKAELADAEDGPVIWLALAAIQCQQDCLQASVRDKALTVIDKGLDLQRWRSNGDAKLLRSRTTVLARLRAKLEQQRIAATTKQNSTPKKRASKTKMAKERKPADLPVWTLGEVVGYRLLSGQFILLHVCGHLSKHAPIFGVLNWRGKRIPPAERVQKLKYVKKADGFEKDRSVVLFSCGFGRASEIPHDRLVRQVATRDFSGGDHTLEDFGFAIGLGVKIEPWKLLAGPFDGFGSTRFRDLDQYIEELLGWK